MQDEIAAYLAAGWSLCKIRPRSKLAFEKGWQTLEGAYSGPGALDDWRGGVGLLHAFSGTCVVDVDDFKLAYASLKPHGIDLVALVGAKDAVVWGRGHPNKIKLLYALPDPLATVKRNTYGFELRCASMLGDSMQDVLPPSIHESGEPYRWMKGNFRNLPPLPAALRALWPRVKALFPEVAGPKAQAANTSLTAAAILPGAGDGVVGNRNEYLSKKLYAMLRRGMGHDEARDEIHRLNDELDEPLSHREVETIWSHKTHIQPERLETPPAAAAVPEAQPQPEFTEFPDLPKGWRWSGRWVEEEVKPDDWQVLCDRPIYVRKVLRMRAQDGTQERSLEIIDHRRGDVDVHVIPVATLVGPKEAETQLLNVGIHANALRMKKYLIRFKDLLETQGTVVDTYTTFGWQADNSFILGNRQYRAHEPMQAISLAAPLIAMGNEMQVHGSLAGWRAAAAEFMAEDNMPQAFAFLMGMAAPLMKLSGERGGMYSLVGKSGQGKSTIQEAICTMFGDPKVFHSRAEDTPNARMIQLASLSNLPMVAEELTKLEPVDLSNLTYSISEGRDKRRADREGKLREDVGNWSTLVVSSSNRSILEQLLSNDSDAEAQRVLEDTIELPKGAKFSHGQELIRMLVANQGSAGHVYAQYLVDHREAITRAIDKARNTISERAGATTKDRIRINMLACAVVAGTVLSASGILQLPVHEFLKYGLTVLANCGTAQDEVMASSTDVLSAFISQNLPGCLRVNGSNVINIGIRSINQPLCMRYDHKINELIVDRKTLRDYVMKRKKNWKQFNVDLGGIKLREQRCVLTAGTGLPPSLQVWCVVLDGTQMDLGTEPAEPSAERAATVRPIRPELAV